MLDEGGGIHPRSAGHRPSGTGGRRRPGRLCHGPGLIAISIDTVKPKRHLQLARLENLRRDSRCVLLVDHYADDWSKLWWVRVHATAEMTPSPAPIPWIEALAARYPRYRRPGAVAGVVVLRPLAVTGWAAG